MNTQEKTVSAGNQELGSLDARLSTSQLLRSWLGTLPGRIKESSFVKYESMARVHVLPAFGAVAPQEINNRRLEQFAQDLLAHGLAPKTVRDVFSLLRLWFEWMGRQGVEVPAQPHVVKIKACTPRTTILTPSEQGALEAYLLRTETPRADGILLALYTGIRVGELCALKWKHISLAEGLLYVQFTLQRISQWEQPLDVQNGRGGAADREQPEEGARPARSKVIITPPKSPDSIRIIPLPGRILSRLQRYGQTNPEAYFLTGQTERFVEPRAMNWQLHRIAERLQIPSIHFHVLRHTFASRCVERNFDIKALSEILGHANVNITLNRYVHVSLEEKRRNMRLLDS